MLTQTFTTATQTYTPEKQSIKESYDEIAVAYLNWSKESHDYRIDYLQCLYDNFPQLKTESGTVLEIGCGNGTPVLDTLLATNPNLKAIGNDISSSQLNLARCHLDRYATRLDLVEQDMTQLQVSDNSLMAIIGLYTIIHLNPEEQFEMIARFSKWLKPSGRVLINFEKDFTDKEVWGDWLDEKGRLVQYGAGRDAMIAQIRQCGFAIDGEVLQPSEETGGKAYVWVIARKV